MVGDGGPTADITIPLVFLFSQEGALLTSALEDHSNVDVLMLPKERQLGKRGGLWSSGQSNIMLPTEDQGSITASMLPAVLQFACLLICRQQSK